MDHVAILNKSRRLLPLILSGKKTIESRWYIDRRTPWNRIGRGDTVYFKDSGDPVSACATVSDVIQFNNLTPTTVTKILGKYGQEIGWTSFSASTIVELSKKNYCILVFLKNVRALEPFNIDKTGYGNMAAWISLDNINTIMK